VREEAVIQALDVASIYDVPKAYHEQGLDREVLKAFGIEDRQKPELSRWDEISNRVHNPEGEITVAIVGKYIELKDAYKSINEALLHGGMANKAKVNIEWIDAEIFEREDPNPYLENVNAILVPGGFGERGIEGKIAAANFARTRNVPYLGICLGMQMAVVEFARSQAGLDGAGSSEFGTPEIPLVGLMTEWEKDGEVEKRGSSDDLGGTMRLGAYEAKLLEGTMAREIYDSETIFERHRHRYEVNMNYRKQLEEAGMTFSGVSPDGLLPEIVEIKDHPWFIGVQFHPELKSRPFDPHPLFAAFVAAAMKQSRLF
jgi:CTP synthase